MNKYQYKFSVIMAVYNAEDYLQETIESLVNQTIGFENIQLILINDGSSDNSEKICLDYQKTYPKNIIYRKKTNGGPSSARNLGLKFRKGKYINFLDSDDTLPENTLKEVYNFFSVHKKIEMVAIPLVFFGHQKGIHPKYKHFGETNRIIDLNEEPYNFILSTSASFYKSESLNGLKYDETMSCEEDTKLNFTLFKKNKKFGYICENGIMYNYRKRESKNSITDSYRSNVSSYYAAIQLLNFVIGKEKQVEKYLQELIIYEFRFRLKTLKKMIFDNEKKYYEMLHKYQYYIDLLDKKHIAYDSKWIDTKVMKYIFLTNVLRDKENLKYKDGFMYYNDIRLFSVSKIEINVRKITFDNKIKFEITYPNYKIEDLNLIIKDKKERVYKATEKIVTNSAYDIQYGEEVACNTIKYEFNLKYKAGRYTYKFQDKEGNEFPISSVVYPKTSFALKNKAIKKFLPKHVMFVDHSDFVLKNRTNRSIRFDKLSTIKQNIKSYLYIKKKYNHLAIERLFNNRNKKYILLSDRPEKAQDNAEAIFKYIYKNRKDLSKYTYFVVSKNSDDYKRLKKIGKVVKIGSFKHKILFLNSKYVMCSHLVKSFFSPFKHEKIDYYMDLIDYKFVWLQHGIAIPDISRAAYKYKVNTDFALTSIKKEYNSFIKPDYLYNKSDVLLNGMPRFDYLKNNPKNIITIIPTWREYLSGKILENGFHDTKSGFEKTNYFENYSQLLKSKRLYKILNRNDLKIQFVLHPGMKGYYQHFEKLKNDRIKIIDVTDVNYEKIFSNSKLLITDYSSVFFDFSYLKKPIIYFQFDQSEFYNLHYTKPNFSYSEDGFGDIIIKVNALIEKIDYYIKKDFRIEQKYINRIEKTFEYTDRKNCERLVDSVIGKKAK